MYSAELNVYQMVGEYKASNSGNYEKKTGSKKNFIIKFGNIDNPNECNLTIDAVDIINDTCNTATGSKGEVFLNNSLNNLLNISDKTLVLEIGGRILDKNKEIMKFLNRTKLSDTESSSITLELEIKNEGRIKKITMPFINFEKYYERYSKSDGEMLYSIKFIQKGSKIEKNVYEVTEFNGE